MSPLFVTGDPEWGDYTVEVRVRPLSLEDMAGLVFRYETNRHYYLFSLAGGKEARLACACRSRRSCAWPSGASSGARPSRTTTRRYYTLKVENQGPRIRAFIDGKLVLEASDGELVQGKVGRDREHPRPLPVVPGHRVPRPRSDAITARIARARGRARQAARDIPAAEAVEASSTTPQLRRRPQRALRRPRRRRPARHADRPERPTRPRRRLRPDQLPHRREPRGQGPLAVGPARPAQRPAHQRQPLPDPRHRRRRPQRRRGRPRLQAAGARRRARARSSARSGCPRRRRTTPRPRPYETRTAATRIVFANLSGKPGRRDLLLKDRYRNFWVFNRDLKFLWQGEGKTGHFPYPLDVDGDGQDELFIGYGLWDAHGQAALEPRRRAARSRRRGRGGQLHAAIPRRRRACTAAGSDEGVPDARSRRARSSKHVARGPRPDRRRREVPPRPAGPAVHGHQLLEEPRHRHPVRRRRQHPHPGRADPLAAAHAAGELARRRPGVRAALGQRPRGRA